MGGTITGPPHCGDRATARAPVWHVTVYRIVINILTVPLMARTLTAPRTDQPDERTTPTPAGFVATRKGHRRR